MRNLLRHRLHRLMDAYYRFMHRHFLLVIPGLALGIAPLFFHQCGLLPTGLALAICLPLMIGSLGLGTVAPLFLDGNMYDAESEKADRIIYRRTQLRRRYPELRLVTDDMIDMLYPI